MLIASILLLVPFGASAQRTGAFTDIHSIESVFGESARSDDGAAPAQDISFEIYVPRRYDPSDPPGLLVFISPVVRAKAPERLNGVFDEHNLIWISVNDSGENREDIQRMLEAYGGLAYVLDRYKIDHRRRYLSGFSGGARVASVFARDYPQFFNGYAFFSGGESWRDEDGGKERALERSRFVFVAGAQDRKLDETRNAFESFKKAGADNIVLMEIERHGHRLPPAHEFGEAIDFLDSFAE
jgi:predicted esterase